MKAGTVFHLPKFQVEAATDGNAWASSWTSHKWSGVLRARQAPQMPILYHRGTWRASLGYDPLDESPDLEHPPFFPSFSESLIFRQYGPISHRTGKPAGFGTPGTRPRIPSTVLYTIGLGTDPSVTGFDTIDAALAPLRDLLTKRRTLTASVLYPGQQDWKVSGRPNVVSINQFLTDVMPVTAITTDGGRTVPASHFTGGDLLYLAGVPLEIAGQDYYTAGVPFESGYIIQPVYTGPFDPHTGLPTGEPTVVFDSARYQYDLKQVEDSIANFNFVHKTSRFRMVIYLRQSPLGSPGYSPKVAAITRPIFQGLASSLRNANVILKGPYPATQDITGIIRNDVEDFLNP